MILNYKKKLNQDLLSVEKPVKDDKLHYSTVSYSGEPLSIQVRGVLEGKAKIKITNNTDKFLELLGDISGSISSIVHKNSEEFFNGKKFSLDKIKNSLFNIYKVEESGEIVVNSKGEDYVCMDYFENEIPFEEAKGTVCDVVLKISGLTYIRNSLVITSKISHVKQCKLKKDKKVVFLDQDSTIKKKEENTDDLDFFAEV